MPRGRVLSRRTTSWSPEMLGASRQPRWGGRKLWVHRSPRRAVGRATRSRVRRAATLSESCRLLVCLRLQVGEMRSLVFHSETVLAHVAGRLCIFSVCFGSAVLGGPVPGQPQWQPGLHRPQAAQGYPEPKTRPTHVTLVVSGGQTGLFLTRRRPAGRPGLCRLPPGPARGTRSATVALCRQDLGAKRPHAKG